MEWILICSVLISVGCSAFQFDTSYDGIWKEYKQKFNKSYPAEDEDARRVLWEQNAQMVMKHNLEAEFGLHSFFLELNKFSDMTQPEQDVYRKCLKHEDRTSDTSSHLYLNECDKSCYFSLPKEVDWRTKGFVTPVKNQGDCGSCWAFSSTGALEGQNKAKTGKLVSLSEQNLVDCSWKQGNAGCDGGWMEYAFQYVIDNEGIDMEKSYPYASMEGDCRFKRNSVGANCTSYVRIRKGSEKDLQAAVANFGPVAVAIDASGGKFMNYRGGVYVDHTCTKDELDHAVLVVGYGSKNGLDYWIVKNSWGSEWGMDGYILMARNHRNQCGIATHAVYPVL